MKTIVVRFICACLTAGLVTGAATRAADAPADAAKATGSRQVKTIGAKPAPKAEAESALPEEATIRLNFRGASVQSVLNYLGDAAGFTIVLNTPVRGTVDVWNNNPLTKTEAVEVLNLALAKNGFAAIQKGRTLTILPKEDALKQNTPVKTSLNPENIPNNSEIVTQILPLTRVNAAQLIRELAPILPATATMVANEAGNSIIITDTQANIRHLAEIVKAIDSSVSAVASIRVFPMKYADAKAVAAVIKELFSSDASSSGSSGGRNSSPFGGFTTRFGGGSRTGGGASSSSSRGSAAAKIVAVADERSNAVVVTAPDDVMPTVEELLTSVDVDVDDLTELKVFRLKFADPAEMAQLLAGLYPDESKASNSANSSRNGSSRTGSSTSNARPSTSTRGTGGAAGGNQSERAKKQSQVIAVPDPRTSSLIVTTSHDLMRQVEETIERLDSDSSRKQKVFVYSLDSADPQQVQQVLQDLFQSQQSNTRNSRNTQNSPFVSRSNPTQTKSGSTTRNTTPRVGGN